MATVGFAIVCDYMETGLFAIVCDLRSAIRDRLRSFAILWKPALQEVCIECSEKFLFLYENFQIDSNNQTC